MKMAELIALSFLLFGLFLFSLGSLLYVRRLMLEYNVDFELQLAVIGFFIIIFALIASKIISKVDLNGRY